MRSALAEYATSKEGPFSWMLGRFIVSASRLAELQSALRPEEAIGLSVIVDAGTDARTWLSNAQSLMAQIAQLHSQAMPLRVEALEVAMAPLATQRETYDAGIGQFAAAGKQAGLDNIPAVIEIPRDARWRGELGSAFFALSRHRLGAKIRCGGLTADAFPSVEDVTAFIGAAVEHDVPMKATAGLHHPIRHRDAGIGATRHGFLNLLAAAAFAYSGMEEAALEQVVAGEEAGAFSFNADGLSWNGTNASVEDVRQARERVFLSYGSCSFDEPTADLQSLGVL